MDPMEFWSIKSGFSEHSIYGIKFIYIMKKSRKFLNKIFGLEKCTTAKLTYYTIPI